MEMNSKYWRILLLSILLQDQLQRHPSTVSASPSMYDGDEWSSWSEWGPCSRTCDGGVTQQFRRCKSPNGCHGVSIKRKMCNMQPCGEGSLSPQDYRADQCKAYNNIKWEGKRRYWVAVEDPEHPCSLICRAEGTEHKVKMSSKLKDGTRCREGSLHVCVDGKCEAVGCDLKIGSPKKIDSCGVCGGDSKSCISPLFRWELESLGPCGAKCGGGFQPVRTYCKNSLTGERVDESSCNLGLKPRLERQSCNIQPCEPQWEAGEWSVCSKSCGGGLKIRKVYCAQEKNRTKIQVAEKLCHHIRKPSTQDACNPSPCPHWHAGPWSMCSVSCGTGTSTRNVLCRDSSNLPSSKCDPRLRPGETKECVATEACPNTPAPTHPAAPTDLVVDPLHRPTKKRRVKIASSTPSPDADEANPEDLYAEEELELLPREHTLPLIQPYPPMDNAVMYDSNALPSEPTKVRVYFSCGWLFFSFVVGEWGPCSSTCGEGRRTREVKCKIFLEFSRTIANLPDKECPGPKPVEGEPCFSPSPCIGGGGGMAMAGDAVQVVDVHQAALADSHDPGVTNVRKTMTVGLPPGMAVQDMTFSWKIMGYSPCSASCLGGTQDAVIQCVRDYDQRIATPVLCMDKQQPDIATTRTCNDYPCPPRWNVTEFGACSKPCGGGVMTREVSCIHEVTRGNTVIVPMSICPSAAPRTEKLCNTVNCPPYWEPGEWGKCSKPCGGGTRSRTMHCKQISALGHVGELSNGEAHCPSSKPSETKPCNKKPCSKAPRPNGEKDEGQSQSQQQQSEYKDRVTLAVKGKGTVWAGVDLKLKCPTGKGLDRGSLIWMKGHEFLNLNLERMELVHKSGVLKIRNTTYSDSGVYTCVFKGRSVSNITLMVKPFEGNRKRGRGKNAPQDSTLYADQQEEGQGVSVPMPRSHGSQTITPNYKMFEPSIASSASSFHSSFFFESWLASSLLLLLTGGGWGKAGLGWITTWEEPRALQVVNEGNFPNSLGSTYEDELSRVERLLSKKKWMNEEEEEEDVGAGAVAVVAWVEGEWTDCLDSECFNWGTALKRRTVSCEFSNGSSVPVDLGGEGSCPLEGKPVEVLECYNPKCLGRWSTQSWSFCKPNSCGIGERTGFKTRVLQCVWYGSGRPAGHACHSLPRPKVTKPCRTSIPCSTRFVLKSPKQQQQQQTHPHPHRHSHYQTVQQQQQKEMKKEDVGELLPDYWELYDQDLNN